MNNSQFIEQMNWRYATKAFDPTAKLTQEELNTLAESLRLSASSFGLQPWHFYFISDQKIKEQLLPHSWNQRQVVDASHVIVLARYLEMNDQKVDLFLEDTVKTRGANRESLTGYENVMKSFLARMSEEKKISWMRDQVYIALGTLLTTCGVLGIDACPMEGFIAPEYDRILGLTEKGHASVVVCPVGRRSKDDKYATTQKVRFPLDEVVSWM